MKSLFLIFGLIIVINCKTSQAQLLNCSCNKKPYSKKISELKSTFPFNEQKRVQIVHFNAPNKLVFGINSNFFSWDTTDFIPKINGKVDTSKFIQKKDLSLNDIDTLIKIIKTKSLNNCAAETSFIEPKYGIIFYNSKNEIIDYLVFDIVNTDYLEPSLGVMNYKQANLGEYCSTKYKLIERLFKRNNIDIKYTTSEYKLK